MLKKVLKSLKKNFRLSKTHDDFKQISGVRYKVLVPRAERFDYAQKMDALDGFTFDPNAKGSSMGACIIQIVLLTY